MALGAVARGGGEAGRIRIRLGVDGSGLPRDIDREVDQAERATSRNIAGWGRRAGKTFGDGVHAGATPAIHRLEASFDGLGAFAERWAKRAALTFTGVAAGAAAAIFKVGSDYERSLNTFQAVSEASVSQMEQVRRKAKELGADMTLPATSAADAAKAMTELVKAGLSVNDTLSASKGVLQLAAAAQVDEARAAEITANALNSFGLKGDQAVRVADLLAGAANASSGEITDMADALQMSSAVFSMAGFSIEDLTTSIALMANKGIQGSDAGTSLKQMLLQLESPTKKASTLMRELGLTVYDSHGKMLPLRDLVGEFTTKLGGLTQQQRDAALATIFGSDAVRAASVVMLGGVGAFDQMRGAVTRQGVAAEVAAAKAKGLKGAFDGLVSQLETVAIEIYERTAPGIEHLVRRLADGVPGAVAAAKGAFSDLKGAFVDAFSGDNALTWSDENPVQKLGTAAGIVADVFRDRALPILKEFVGFVRDNFMPIMEAAAVMLATRFAMNVANAAAQMVSAVAGAGGLGAALTALAGGPVGIVILAIGALVAALVVLYTKNEGFRDFVKEAWADISTFVVDAWQGYIKPTWDALWGFIFDDLIPAAQSLWQTMQDVWDGITKVVVWAWDNVLEPTWQVLKLGIRGIIALALDLWEIWDTVVWRPMAAIVEWAWDNAIKPTWDAIVGFINTVLLPPIRLIGSVAEEAWGVFLSAAKTAWGGLTTVIGPALRLVGNLVSGFFRLVANVADVVDLHRVAKVLRDAAAGANSWGETGPTSDSPNNTGADNALGVFATGGIPSASAPFVTNRPRAIVGEGNPLFPEYVLATDPRYRDRNERLWREYGRRTGLWYEAVGVPGFDEGGIVDTAGGVVGGIVDQVGDVVGDVVGDALGVVRRLGAKALETIWPKLGVPDHLGGIVPASINSLRQAAIDLIGGKADAEKSLFDTAQRAVAGAGGAASGAGGTVPEGSLSDWINEAIRITGVDQSWAAPVYRRAMYESGGDPKAINLWDSNATELGDPSKGLMQTISGTFEAYKLAGHDDIWNPVDNLIAAIRYIQSRYGSIFEIDPPTSGYAAGGKLPPLPEFHAGGVVPEDMAISAKAGEMVLDPELSAVVVRAARDGGIDYGRLADELRRAPIEVHAEIEGRELIRFVSTGARDRSIARSRS